MKPNKSDTTTVHVIAYDICSWEKLKIIKVLRQVKNKSVCSILIVIYCTASYYCNSIYLPKDTDNVALVEAWEIPLDASHLYFPESKV